MLRLYQCITSQCGFVFQYILRNRASRAKEDLARISERSGVASLQRPEGKLLYLHAASVGEAQSALILIDALLAKSPHLSILVTTGTVTSAQMMADKLPERAFHQFMPLDHPDWVARFLDHWAPDAAIWMESEFWPNMVMALQSRSIPSALVNARLSPASYNKWKFFKAALRQLCQSFDPVLAQTDKDAERFNQIGVSTQVSGNLKYNAAALPFDASDMEALQTALKGRDIVVYASTHAGEEEMICRIHKRLQAERPNILSLIIPRHPERGVDIDTNGLKSVLRGSDKILPDADTQIYIADTLGELGLFYRLAEIVYIGRSLSDDGGGGHNPIEAAQLGCAILHGPHVQNLKAIYDDLAAFGGSISVADEDALLDAVCLLLQDGKKRAEIIENADVFSHHNAHILDAVMDALSPIVKHL